MSDPQPEGSENGQQGRSIELALPQLSPEEALRGFMEVDPEKVKERLEGDGRDEGEADDR